MAKMKNMILVLLFAAAHIVQLGSCASAGRRYITLGVRTRSSCDDPHFYFKPIWWNSNSVVQDPEHSNEVDDEIVNPNESEQGKKDNKIEESGEEYREEDRIPMPSEHVMVVGKKDDIDKGVVEVIDDSSFLSPCSNFPEPDFMLPTMLTANEPDEDEGRKEKGLVHKISDAIKNGWRKFTGIFKKKKKTDKERKGKALSNDAKANDTMTTSLNITTAKPEYVKAAEEVSKFISSEREAFSSSTTEASEPETVTTPKEVTNETSTTQSSVSLEPKLSGSV